MSKVTREWGWKWLSEGHRRNWPYFVTRLLNNIGNYGLRGTFRESVVRGAFFWLRNNLWWKWQLHRLIPHFRAKRGMPYKPSELCYSQVAKCRCGAGLAYWSPGFFLRNRPPESEGWCCADILMGRIPLADGMAAVPLFASLGGMETSDAKHDYLPFNFYEVRSEDQPNRNGIQRKVLWGLLGERYATCREVGDSTRFLGTKQEQST